MSIEDRSDVIVQTYAKLKDAGVEAVNPDQCTAAYEGFRDQIKACHFHGFSLHDIVLMFDEALADNPE